jgi:hypothetical protein
MKSRRERSREPGALDLIEEATQLLRAAPAGLLAAYYAGAIPFILGALYFWADMSHSPFARRHVVEESLGMGLLFIWMKIWQARFADLVRARIAGATPPQAGARQFARLALRQTLLQSCGLFLLPASIVPILPFPWALAFFQNCAVLAGEPAGGTMALVRKSARLAALWPRQNIIFLAFLGAFGLMVFLNWLTVCLSAPHLVKMLLGIDSAFTRSWSSLLNTTTVASLCGLTYLCVDPLLKTVYVLRCFHGESLRSGEDLKARLRQLAPPSAAITAGLVVLLTVLSAGLARAADAPAPPPAAARATASGVSSAELDRAINQVIQQRKYIWRLPRNEVENLDEHQGLLARFLNQVAEKLRDWLAAGLEWLRDVWRRLFEHHSSGGEGSSGYQWMVTLELLLWGLTILAVAALVILFYRAWNSRHAAAPVVAQAIQPAPDLAGDHTHAGQLPGDEWIAMGRDLLERGEFRLAMRAFHLATLAHLAERNLVTLARFKSNRDYQRELLRRGHALGDLPGAFVDNVSVFERVWYGAHEVNREMTVRFAATVERIRGVA